MSSPPGVLLEGPLFEVGGGCWRMGGWMVIVVSWEKVRGNVGLRSRD